MSGEEFNMFGDAEYTEYTRKIDKRNSIGIAVGLGLSACFVLGVILCMGLLVTTVIRQADLANGSLSNATASIHSLSVTASAFADNSEVELHKLQSAIKRMAIDLDVIAKKIGGFGVLGGVPRSVSESSLDRSGIHGTDR